MSDMRITIYRFERGAAGAFSSDGAFTVAQLHDVAITEFVGASGLIGRTTIPAVTFEGRTYRVEHEAGFTCIFVPSRAFLRKYKKDEVIDATRS